MKTCITIAGSFIALTLCTLVAIPSAQAQAIPVPDQCDGVRELRFFNLGVRKGRSLTQQAIATLGEDDTEICADPEALEELADIIRGIVEDIVLPPAPSQAVRCHVLGQVAGMVAEVVDFQEACDLTTCVADGELIGAISALLYCELSIALDGLVAVELFTRLATDACGERFQAACDDEFAAVATSDPACLPFTEDPFDVVFNEAQNNQCASNPEEPEPTPLESNS